MYHTLLVPLDGSAFAEQGLPWALRIAGRTKAAIHLVRVHRPLGAGAGSNSSFPVGAASLKASEHDYLANMKERLRTGGCAAVSSALLEGPIEESLLQQAQTIHADLIIMTTHARGPFGRMWLGSVADRMVQQTTLPLLLVRPHQGPLDLVVNGASSPAPHILIPLDGSSLAEQALRPALSLGIPLEARYTLLQVIDPVQRDISERGGSLLPGRLLAKEMKHLEEEMQAQAEVYLGRIAQQMRTQTGPVQTRVVSHPEPEVAIVRYAQENKMDLIALATHGRGGLVRLFQGSVTAKVLQNAPVPLLIYRPNAERSAKSPGEKAAKQGNGHDSERQPFKAIGEMVLK